MALSASYGTGLGLLLSQSRNGAFEARILSSGHLLESGRTHATFDGIA
jgi:hypothetical protein